ncbi:MAG: TOBE domain-containing protein, partial [Shinella sp.]
GRGRILLDCGQTVRMRVSAGFAGTGEPLKIAVRPENLVVGAAASDRLNQCKGRIADTTYLGDHLRALVDIGGGQTMVVRKPLLDFASRPAIGEDILIGWNEGDGRVFA